MFAILSTMEVTFGDVKDVSFLCMCSSWWVFAILRCEEKISMILVATKVASDQ